MTEPTDVLILNSLMTQLADPDLGYPVSMPLVAYVPTSRVSYIDVHPILRAVPISPALSFAGSTILTGIFQVDAVVDSSGGEAPGLRIAALITNRFVAGTQLVAGTDRLQIIKPPNIAAAIKDASWVRFPVSISYVLIRSN